MKEDTGQRKLQMMARGQSMTSKKAIVRMKKEKIKPKYCKMSVYSKVNSMECPKEETTGGFWNHCDQAVHRRLQKVMIG